MVVRKVRGKRAWAVYSKRTGRKLSRNYRTKRQARNRLRQIEYFKSL
jgi:hypothetical protein